MPDVKRDETGQCPSPLEPDGNDWEPPRAPDLRRRPEEPPRRRPAIITVTGIGPIGSVRLAQLPELRNMPAGSRWHFQAQLFDTDQSPPSSPTACPGQGAAQTVNRDRTTTSPFSLQSSRQEEWMMTAITLWIKLIFEAEVSMRVSAHGRVRGGEAENE